MAKFSQQNLLTNVYVEALRQIAPDMGAYVNEVGSATISPHLRARILIMILQADPYEPNSSKQVYDLVFVRCRYEREQKSSG
jgi:hypothetical protein